MLYNCPDCRNWHSGVDHVCGPKAPDQRDQRTLERAVVKAARGVLAGPGISLVALRQALNELDGLDRPLAEG